MSRKEELRKIVCGGDPEQQEMLNNLIDEMLFIEARLAELKELPFIKVHPKNPALQKPTPAAKQYKELLQQYTNIIKVLDKNSASEASGEETPLRKWLNSRVNTGT